MRAQSPSSLNTYLTCPRQYEAKYITQEVIFKDTPNTVFGSLVHKSIENYLKAGEPLPTLLLPLKPLLDNMKQVLFGAEVELAVDEFGSLTDFHASDAYQRCIVDAILTNADKSVVVCVDWKTGKKYPAQTQHDMIKKCTRAKFPNAKIITFFVYLFAGSYDRQEFTGQPLDSLDANMDRLHNAHQQGLFQPRPSGLCKRWCDVLSCEYNGRNRETD